MRRGQGERVPVPSENELKKAAVQEHEIVACAGKRYGSLIALTVAFHNGDISTVSLDELGWTRLLSALKALVPNSESIAAAPVRDGAVQEGYLSG